MTKKATVTAMVGIDSVSGGLLSAAANTSRQLAPAVRTGENSSVFLCSIMSPSLANTGTSYPCNTPLTNETKKRCPTRLRVIAPAFPHTDFSAHRLLRAAVRRAASRHSLAPSFRDGSAVAAPIACLHE